MIRFLVLGMKTVGFDSQTGWRWSLLGGIPLVLGSLVFIGCTGKTTPAAAAGKKGDGAGAPVTVAKGCH